MKTDRKISGLRGLPREGGEYRSHITAPLLVLAVFLLLRLSVYIDSKLTRENEYAAVILLQLMIFVIPAVIYLAITRNTAAGLRIRPVGIGHLLLILSAVIVIESGGVLLNWLINGYDSLVTSYDLWGIFISKTDGSASDTLFLVMAYALLPAVCEELVFRSVLCAEYERRSMFAAVLLPPLFFAMLHFDPARFPSYFGAGLVLTLTLYATRSVLAPVIVHFASNLLSIFSRTYLRTLYDLGGEKLFIFIAAAAFLLFTFLFCAEAARLYRNYSSGDYSDSYRGSASETARRENSADGTGGDDAAGPAGKGAGEKDAPEDGVPGQRPGEETNGGSGSRNDPSGSRTGRQGGTWTGPGGSGTAVRRDRSGRDTSPSPSVTGVPEFFSKHPRAYAAFTAFFSPTALLCYIFYAVIILL
ncbi:MAG: CPBP family intramembrane metalloprotease [Clostridia bacterium]|nr:CPBP family intramembrane metalloprotease [Clostridia bacterium]